MSKGKQRDQAIRVLTNELSKPKLQPAVDQDGRRVWLDAQLRATQLMVEANQDAGRIREQRRSLRALLEDYSVAIPASQRQFAMREFRELFLDAPMFLTFEAEQLASQAMVSTDPFAASTAARLPQRDFHSIRPQSESPVVLLFKKKRMAELLSEWVNPLNTSDGQLVAIPAGTRTIVPGDAATITLASTPGWNLTVHVNDPFIFESASRNQTALYSLAALLTITAVAVGVVATAIFVQRQLRIAQLKNDLAAVVTHELRTPLASIRVLVDTLLDGRAANEPRTNEYLKLIAQENERLSRLIENFLTFSRLERNQQRFDFCDADPAQLTDRAMVAINGKLNEPGCVFERKLGVDLPRVRADPDAMVTVKTTPCE